MELVSKKSMEFSGHSEPQQGRSGKWNQAKVLKRLGAVTYLVQESQRQRTVHVDHMLPGRGNVGTLPQSLPSPLVENEPPVTMNCACPAVLPSAPVMLIPPTVLTKPTEQVVEVPSPTANKKSPEKRRYPERVRVPPKKTESMTGRILLVNVNLHSGCKLPRDIFFC
ncbi:hypothetical protein Q7C36_014779 [Tachysurus vachellii]|uniref:Uncharacterized protein n=1 Tax=Tachysurus vachellii TaxID=175792 RepID=A0AA88MAX1_TACVA|nr:hypothetical protein Q7C36_014779 [Tachysurus vachellii]